MELFTLGIGNYTEHDVKEVARAFTGWGLKEGQFFFDAKQHDDGEKEVLGKQATIDALAAEYVRSGYDVRAVLRALFTSDAFKADAALRARVKSPVELVI